MSAAFTDGETFEPPATFAVNGQMTAALPKEVHLPQPDELPMSVVLPSIFGGLAVFAVMFHYSR